MRLAQKFSLFEEVGDTSGEAHDEQGESTAGAAMSWTKLSAECAVRRTSFPPCSLREPARVKTAKRSLWGRSEAKLEGSAREPMALRVF